MGDASCMRRSARVAILQDSCVVVVSATSGTTNDLIALAQTAQKSTWIAADEIIQKIKLKHSAIAQEIGVDEKVLQSLSDLYHEMESLAKGIHFLRDCSLKALDAMQSLGERMSSLLFAEAFNQELEKLGKKPIAKLLDARDVVRTDDSFGKARPMNEAIVLLCAARMSSCISGESIFITQGFIGSTEDGFTTTLGRGGSDYSAAIFAEGIGADILEIWTDVPGIATTDPRVCKAAQPIDEISFKEASELATFGAKVLHPATLLPAIRQNIPVFVGSSFESGAKGTWVRKEVEKHPLIRAMATRKKQVLVTISTPEMLHTHGFLFQIFKVFNDHRVSIDAITTSEISVSVTLDDSALLNRKLISDLSQFADVQVEEGLCLVSLIGNNINHTAGLSKQIFEAIPDINVRMICLGASKHNFCFLVAESQGDEVIQRLHKKFIEV